MWKSTFYSFLLLNAISVQRTCCQGQENVIKSLGRKFNRKAGIDLRKHWKYVQFQSGDIIECEISGVMDHTLLATSDSSVIHVIREGCSGVNGDIQLVEEAWSTYHKRRGEAHKVCGVIGKAKLFDSIERARADVSRHAGRCLYYNVVSCNCEHWVNWWTIGTKYSPQSVTFSDTDELCNVGDEGERSLAKVQTKPNAQQDVGRIIEQIWNGIAFTERFPEIDCKIL